MASKNDLIVDILRGASNDRIKFSESSLRGGLITSGRWTLSIEKCRLDYRYIEKIGSSVIINSKLNFEKCCVLLLNTMRDFDE